MFPERIGRFFTNRRFSQLFEKGLLSVISILPGEYIMYIMKVINWEKTNPISMTFTPNL